MTVRAITLGLLLAALIASVTYFNDFVIHQTMLIATHLPVAVFGLLLVGVLGVGPLWGKVTGGGGRMSAGEVGVVVAMGLAACAWPGSGFWRYTAGLTAMPAHLQQTRPNWGAQGVMSYVPGGGAGLAPGQVVDWRGLAGSLVAAGEGESMRAEARTPGVGEGKVTVAVWGGLSESARAAARRVAMTDDGAADDRRQVLTGVNAALVRWGEEHGGGGTVGGQAAMRRARDALAAELPGVVLPLPGGDGALLEGGRLTTVTQGLVLGDPAAGPLEAVESVPWRAWMPTLGLWVGSAGLLGLAGLCVAMVVHPQWSQRELLAYPIARLVGEVTAREPGARLPVVARDKLFWLGLVSVLVIHLANGLDVWFQTGVKMDLTLPLGPLRTVFPDASKVGLSWFLFTPRVYFAVMAFAFFLPRSVSFSIGIAHIAFVAVGAVMISNGLTWGYERSKPANTSFLRLGAFVGMGLMIAYAGRRYYLDVLGSAAGMARRPGTPGYAVWAARVGVLCTAGATAMLVRGGLAWDLAVVLVGLILLSWLVLSRVVCETGLFFVTNAFIPSTMIGGLLGFEAIGPTGMVMLTLASWVLIADPREALMPFVATGLRVVDRGGVAPGRAGSWLAVATVVSLVVAGVVTLSQQHHHGLVSMQNSYATQFVPSEAFDVVSRELVAAEAAGTVNEAVSAAPLMRFASMRVWPGGITWGGLGLALVIGCAVLRLRVPWWPIHPILFVMWGTYAVACFYFSFLLGWAVKSAVVGVGGAKAYGSVKPLMIGLISGEILAILFWTVVGAVYYFSTGLAPLTYQIFPG